MYSYGILAERLSGTIVELGSVLLLHIRILARQIPQILPDLLALHKQRLTVKQHEQHPSALVRADIAPLVHRPPVDAHVACAHDLALPAVERELELAFDDDAVVD